MGEYSADKMSSDAEKGINYYVTITEHVLANLSMYKSWSIEVWMVKPLSAADEHWGGVGKRLNAK